MLKIFLNLILNLIIGKLKPVLLKNIEAMDASMISNEDKRKAVVANLKTDLITAGKEVSNSLVNLAVEAGVSLIRGKLR